MAKRNKRLGKGIESLKKEIDKHFLKLEEDIKEGQIDRGRYHFKEIDRSLLLALERKIEVLKIESDVVKSYREKLNKLKVKLFG